MYFLTYFVGPNRTEIIKAAITANDTILVHWRNLTLVEARGWIVHYTVHWWDAASKARATASSQNTTGLTTLLEIKREFDIFQDYNIVVTATTVAGQGSDSAVFILKGRPRPRSPAGIYVEKFSVLIN